jgi:4-hydroxy-tetrahydrodipicolinate synthase
VLRNDITAGRALMQAALPVFSLLEGSGKYVQYVKAGAEAMGIPVGAPRPPLCQLSEGERRHLDVLLDGLRSQGLA